MLTDEKMLHRQTGPLQGKWHTHKMVTHLSTNRAQHRATPLICTMLCYLSSLSLVTNQSADCLKHGHVTFIITEWPAVAKGY